MAIAATHHHEGPHTLRLLQVSSEKLSDALARLAAKYAPRRLVGAKRS